MTLHSHASTNETATPVKAKIQRACACGAAAGVSGKCGSCAATEKLGPRSKLTLGAPGDRYEQEADRIAEKVVSGQAGALGTTLTISPLIQRQNESEEEDELQMKTVEGSSSRAEASIQRQPEEEEEEQLQTKQAAPAAVKAAAAPSATQTAARVVAAGGRPLSRSDRSYFEPRFGHSLSHVRLHTGADAQSAARGINARAYTLGNHIAFAPGQYQPETPRGRFLLAHELTHTFQQNGGRVIRRTCPSDPADIPQGTEDDFEKKASEALSHGVYKRKLNWRAKGYTRHIIDGARRSECPMYYIDKLLLMFNTPMASGKKLAEKNREQTEKEEKKEATRLGQKSQQDLTGVEEEIADRSEPNFVWRKGEGGTRFQVDRTDPTHIVVRLKVHLKPKGDGDDDDVKRTKGIVDAIEKASATRGYTLDIDFVDRGGKDIFTVGVDPSKWTDSGNWVGDPQTIAHEAHHLLGLEDRYDYIKGHAANPNMEFETRLYWFREQMVRAFDPLADQSMMKDEHSAASMNDQDICALAGGNFDDCINARLGDLPIGQIEGRSKALVTPYIPQNAGMIERLREAWNDKPEKDKKRNCDQTDPLCGWPPKPVFGDPKVIEADADKFPLTNPHEQPKGETLKRRRKWQKADTK